MDNIANHNTPKQKSLSMTELQTRQSLVGWVGGRWGVGGYSFSSPNFLLVWNSIIHTGIHILLLRVSLANKILHKMTCLNISKYLLSISLIIFIQLLGILLALTNTDYILKSNSNMMLLFFPLNA